MTLDSYPKKIPASSNSSPDQATNHTSNHKKKWLRRLGFLLAALLGLSLISAYTLLKLLAQHEVQIHRISGIQLFSAPHIEKLAVVYQGVPIEMNHISINTSPLIIKIQQVQSQIPKKDQEPLQPYQFSSLQLEQLEMHSPSWRLDQMFTAKINKATVGLTINQEPTHIYQQQIHQLHIEVDPNNDGDSTNNYSNNSYAIAAKIHDIDVTVPVQTKVEDQPDIEIIQYRANLKQLSAKLQIAKKNPMQQPIPLSVAIDAIKPSWQSLEEIEQTIQNIHIDTDLTHWKSKTTIKINQAHLIQPQYLPLDIKKSDSEYQGFHIGQAIANLAQLPVNFSINQLTYLPLIYNAEVFLQQPSLDNLVTDQEQPQRPHFYFSGHVLSQQPYKMDLSLFYQDLKNMTVTTGLVGKKGNSVFCDSVISADLPLPKRLDCQLNLKQTKDITDNWQMTDAPNAILNKPITLQARQINHLIPNEVKNDDIKSAHYHVDLMLPQKINIQLPEAWSWDLLNIPRQVQVTNDGKLSIELRYAEKFLQLSLRGKQESLGVSVQNKKQHIIKTNLDINKLKCFPTKLQCHGNGVISNHLSSLLFSSLPQQIDTSSPLILQTKSHWQLTYKDQQFIGQLTDNQLSLPSFRLQQPSYSLELSNNQLAVPQWVILANNLANTHQWQWYIPKDKDITFTSNAEATMAIETNNQASHPVQKITSPLKMTMGSFWVDKQSKQSIKIKSHIHSQLSPILNGQTLPKLDLNTQLQLAKGDISLENRIHSLLPNQQSVPLADIKIRHNLNQQSGLLDVRLSPWQFDSKRRLSQYYLPEIPTGIELVSGKLEGHLVTHYRQFQPISSQVSLYTKELSGMFFNIPFHNANIQLELQQDQHGIQTRSPAIVDIEKIKLGIPLTNIRLSGHYQDYAYKLNHGYIELLDGFITTTPTQSRQPWQQLSLPISIHGINLAALMSQIDQQDIELTGILDGKLTLALHKGLFDIHNGKLIARYPGGLFRYKQGSTIDNQVEAMDDNNPIVVSKLLKNYHYRTLVVDIDYSNKGILKAKSQFKGYNPDFQNGRPIHLNLNIEDNVPALIKTLSLLNSSDVERYLQEQFGKQE
ncbi:TPA: YdbH domain-containing protein [Photobacterium damselae]